MHWEYPHFLLALWLLPVVAGLLIWSHRRRRAAAERFAEPAMRSRLMPAMGGARPWIKGGAIVIALGLFLVAAAGPRFGSYYREVVQRGADVFVVLDVSRSMTAEDVAPSRLERAKSDIRDLLDRLVGDRVGLIVFAGKPVVKVPLTTDQGFFEMMLDSIDTDSAPRGGTAIGDAIRKAVAAMPKQPDRDRAIVLISDGEDHESMPLEAARHAAEFGIKIFTVALGDSTEGARIPTRADGGELGYMKYAGKEHWSKVDERLLADIALETGGAYIPAGTTAYDLGRIYEDHLASLTRGEFRAEQRRRYHERFQWFLALGLLVLFAGAALPEYPKSESRVAFRLPRKRVAAAVVFGLMAWPGTVHAGVNDVPRAVREGIELYDAGEFDRAAEMFSAAREKRADDARLAFNTACAKAAAGNAEEAIPLFQQAAVTPDAELAARCHYNLGRLAADRAKAALGDKPETAENDARRQTRELVAAALGHWRDCLAMKPAESARAATETTTPRDKSRPGENTTLDDAKYNIELTRLWLERMEETWKESDRRARIEKMNLGEMLRWMEGEQHRLRTTARDFEDREPSPLHRLAVHETADSQRDLAGDIDPLKQKLVHEINQPETAALPGSPGVATPPGGCNAPGGGCGTPGVAALGEMDPEQRQHAVELLSGMADRAGDSMKTASEYLAEHEPAEAVHSQAEAIEGLDQMTTVLTPYADLVHKSVTRQKELVGEVKGQLEPAKPNDGAEPAGHEPVADATADVAGADHEATPPETPVEHDPAETAWRQRFVERWASIMVGKAKQGLKNMPPPEPETPDPTEPPNPEATAGQTDKSDPKTDAEKNTVAGTPDPQAEARKQQEALRESMELAVEHGPEVQRLVAQSAADLDDQRLLDALPRQEEALRLLEKIAEPLKRPNQDQQQQDQQQDKQQQDQKNQDQKNQDQQDKKDQQQDKQNQQDQQQDKQNQQDQQQDEQNQQDQQKNQDDQEQKNQEEAQQDKKQENQDSQKEPNEAERQEAAREPRDLSKQEAEALMQQVLQRSREREKARKELQKIISRPEKVEKDW